MSELRERIIEAHGGRARWSRVERLMATMSLGGGKFLYHLQPRPLRDVEVGLEPARCRVTIAPFFGEGVQGVFDPQRVWTESATGEVLSERRAPGPVIRSPRHWFGWDELDVLFVVGLTAWHALLFPWLLSRSGLADEPLEPLDDGGRRLDRLDVWLPADLPLPSPRQTVCADVKGLVQRIDYGPQAYASWIRIGHLMAEHESVDGLILPTEQTLYPLMINQQPWRATRFMWLRFDDLSAALSEPVQARRPG
ncbi:MAG TPA: hypothetical protein VKA32_00440 [Gammaproteobacteria bacterium]|nr:hypothetical protein [Gammaproteobacteria bacterium]